MASTNLNVEKETKKNDSLKTVDENNNNNEVENKNNNSSSNSSNNNNTNEHIESPKLKYELPSDYKYVVPECICDRPQKVFECGSCHHYFHGRIALTCDVHPKDFFLMDFRSCPYCFSPTSDAIVSPLTWEQVRKMEDAEFPDDGDGL